jgi:hypothetical protein
MKNKKSILIIALLCVFSFCVKAQNTEEQKLNLPGDNLNLYAVLNLFQESETLELFEKNLNAEESKINNLDLNNDDKIDYIKVIDNVDGETHLIILQVAINDKENQDVAVFVVNKSGNNEIQIQLIGDEELYGKDYIIEPKSSNSDSEGSTPNPGYSTNTTNSAGKTIVVEKTIIVQVQTWPVITYMYTPAYVRWRSPWYWGYYPPYWNPWSPYYWHYYYGYHYHWHNHYHGHYYNSRNYRTPIYRNNYYNRSRSQSNTVISNRNLGNYNKTYSHPETKKAGSDQFVKSNQNSSRPTFTKASMSAGDNKKQPEKPSISNNLGSNKQPNINTKPANNNIPSTTSQPSAFPATPKPATPKPATPKPASPKPAAPKPASPKPAAPKPASPKPAAPKPAKTAQTPTKF